MGEVQAAEIGVICAVVGTGLGAIGKAVVDAYQSRAKEKLDQLQIALKQIEDFNLREERHDLALQQAIVDVAKWKARCEQLELDLQYVRGQLALCADKKKEGDNTNA